jgi:hypothetical protein
MTKTAQVLSSLNENFFDFFDFAVKKFCGSSLAHKRGVIVFLTHPASPPGTEELEWKARPRAAGCAQKPKIKASTSFQLRMQAPFSNLKAET